MKSKVMLLFFLLLGTTAKAAIQYPLDELKVIEVSISRQGLTRITVKGDRIVNVFGVAGEYVLEADETQGQVFIRPVGTGVFKPISLTLTTEAGHTQDLRLAPKDQAPEALILEAKNSAEQEQGTSRSNVSAMHLKVEINSEIANEKHAPISLTTHHKALMHEKMKTQNITRDEIETLLHACREGRIPLGYKSMPLSLNTLHGPYLLVRKIKGEKVQCLTYEIKNTTKNPLVFSEEAFVSTLVSTKKNPTKVIGDTQREIIAVLMAQKNLNPGKRMIVHVVTTASY